MKKQLHPSDIKAAIQCLEDLRSLLWPLHQPDLPWSAETVEQVSQLLIRAGYGPRRMPGLTKAQRDLLERAKSPDGYPAFLGRIHRTHYVLVARGLVSVKAGNAYITTQGKEALDEVQING